MTFDINAPSSSTTGVLGATIGTTNANGQTTTTFTCRGTAGIVYPGAHAAGINSDAPITCT